MYFIDVLGTLINESDKNTIYGSKSLIRYLNKHNIPYVVISNNTKLKSQDALNNLKEKGLEIRYDAYLDPFCVLSEVCQAGAVAMFGSEAFISVMQSMGYTQDLIKPKAVIIASYDNFSFEDFAKIIELVNNGAQLIAMHEASTYKKNAKIYPGIGAVVKMLENATSKSAKILGKPSRLFYEIAYKKVIKQSGNAVFLERTALMDTGKSAHELYIDFSEIDIISDDAKGDLQGAKELGMKTILVLSGKTQSLENSGVKKGVINQVFNHVGAFLESIENEDME